MAELRDAEIVIVGGGIVGCSIAYHLTRMGKKDVLLIEKAGLTHGATWHAAGLVGQLRSSRNATRMLQHSVALYDGLEAETGQATSWKKVGSLRLACTGERMLELKRSATMAKSFGLELHLLSPREARDLFPLMTTDKVLGAAYIPSDGYVDPSMITQALATGARQGGATIVQNTLVTGMTVRDGRVAEVITDKGTVRAGAVVNAAGFWGRDLGDLANVRVPVIALEHQFLVTEPIPGMPDHMPTMRDPDHLIYYKPEVGGFAIGGWEANTVTWSEGGIPWNFGPQLLPENFERFEQLAVNATMRTPAINDVGVRQLVNGPIPWSADSGFIMGKSPEYDNYFCATGFTFGIAAGGGAGKMMAEWIVDGEPSLDLWETDVRRFNAHQNSATYLYDRTVELYGKYYLIHFPGAENKTARGIRRSPLYHLLAGKGAVYGSRGGWERPNWFAPEGIEPAESDTFLKPAWFDWVAAEHKAVRQRVALIDMTSFSKIRVRGPGAFAALQRLAAANLDKPTGAVVYTQFLNPRGGIEADLTICRLGENDFYIVTGSAFGVHDLDWIRSNSPNDGSVVIDDVTSSRSVVNLCGPKARAVLEKCTDDDVSNAAFPFAQCRQIGVGAAPVLAVRISYVGELGWELHVPSDFACHVYETLWRAGQEFGIANVGYRAIDSLRMEKGYLYWSADITPDYNPYEAGLGFRVAMNKGDFVGRDALVRIKEEGPGWKLCHFVLERTAWVRGGEAIMRNGEVLGVTTSGNFGHTIGKPMVVGYLPAAEAGHQDYEIEVFGETYAAKRSAGPVYDPKMEKMKI